MANYKIEDIEGIGTVIGDKLRSIGETDTDSLLENARMSEHRKLLAEKFGLTEVRILKFANIDISLT